jgi:hypothetical protein
MHILKCRKSPRLTLRLSPNQLWLLQRYGGEPCDVEPVGASGLLAVLAHHGTWRTLLHNLDARLHDPALEPSWDKREWAVCRRVVERLWRVFNLPRAVP